MSTSPLTRPDGPETHTTAEPTSTVTRPDIRTRLRQRRKSPWWRVLLVRLFIVVLLVVIAGGWLLYAADETLADRIYPQVRIGGVPVGEMTPPEAIAMIEAHYAPYLEQPVTLVYGEQRWTPTLAELGGHLDIQGAVERALALGDLPETRDRLRTAAALWENGYELPLRLIVDQTAMQHYLAQELEILNIPAKDAELVFDNSFADVVLYTRPAALGQQVLIDETLPHVTTALYTLEPQTVMIHTRPLAPLMFDDAVEATYAELNVLLQAPITLQTQDGYTWTWTEHDIAKLITVERVYEPDDPDYLTVSIDQEQIRNHVAWLADNTQAAGTSPRAIWQGSTIALLEQGTPGAVIDIDAGAELVYNTLTAPERNLAMPYREVPVPNSPEELAQLGFNNLLGVGRTSFIGSESYRITNIIAGMNLLNGTLLAPGETFSFNDTIEVIDSSTGFVQGYAIVEEEVELEWGGGICQDSTTMLRAAFWAGLPITEWQNHSYYIDWYDRFGYNEYGDGPGLDATIFLGGPDLKFVNDTGHWIMIMAYANPATMVATVEIYGTDTGRTVELEGPYIQHLNNGGINASMVRVIKEGGVEVSRQEYWSVYKPWFT